MNDRPLPNGDDEELSYEDFDDVSWSDPEELEPINLDVLDDEIEPEPESKTRTETKVTTSEDTAADDLLDVLDDEIEPEPDESPEAEAPKSGETVPESEDEPQTIQTEDATQKPDEEPESAEALLDALDDEVEVAEQAESDKSEAVSPSEEVKESDESDQPEQATAAPEPDTTAEPQTIEPTPEPEPEHEPAIYQILIPLPPELAAQVLSLRNVGGITDSPPPGLELAVPFHTDQLADVESALHNWARAHLPLQLELTGVLAQVIGDQQYVAAWTLDPEEELGEAQRDLVRALVPMITPLPGKPAKARVRVIIGDHIAPNHYPRVIGQMQRDYQPYVWYAESVSLFQAKPQDDDKPLNWETVKTFD